MSVYSSKFQNVDEDEYGGIMEIVKEGLFTAFAVFLVRIIHYSSILISDIQYIYNSVLLDL